MPPIEVKETIHWRLLRRPVTVLLAPGDRGQMQGIKMRATNMANGVRSGESHSEHGRGCVGRTQPRRRLCSAEAVAIDRTSTEVSR